MTNNTNIVLTDNIIILAKTNYYGKVCVKFKNFYYDDHYHAPNTTNNTNTTTYTGPHRVYGATQYECDYTWWCVMIILIIICIVVLMVRCSVKYKKPKEHKGDYIEYI